MKKRMVVALGGNALGNTAAEQLQLVTETAKSIVDLIAAGNEVVVAHGNGPQVGMINLGLSTAAEAKAIKADMPFPECGAMSEGYIGYHLQQAIGNELASRGMDKPVATIVTQTVVSKDDPAFQTEFRYELAHFVGGAAWHNWDLHRFFTIGTVSEKYDRKQYVRFNFGTRF